MRLDETETMVLRAAAAREALAGRAYEQAEALTGLSLGTISKLMRGAGVGRRTLIAFADGLRVVGDVRVRLFRAFGFADPGPTAAPYDGREYLQLRRRWLAQKYGAERVGTFSFHPEVTADTPPEVIDEWIERWEEDIRRDEP